MRRALVVLAAGALAGVLFIVLRPERDKAIVRPTTSAPTETDETAPVVVPQLARVNIEVRGGEVVRGVARVTVRLGTPVAIVVAADVDDRVHVHGYDLIRDVAPGAPAELRFDATTEGRFAVELEKRRLLVAELQVER